MKTSIRKIPAVFLLVVLCLTAFPVSAFAADAVNVAIPVSVELSGETPSPEETYTVVLQAVDDAPMPAENTLEITGEGTAAFPAITYSRNLLLHHRAAAGVSCAGKLRRDHLLRKSIRDQ